jgi:hypothetical protein
MAVEGNYSNKIASLTTQWSGPEIRGTLRETLFIIEVENGPLISKPLCSEISILPCQDIESPILGKDDHGIKCIVNSDST